MIIHYDITQGTSAWDDIRAGKFSSSSADKFLSGIKTKGFRDLMQDIACGRIHGASTDPKISSASMRRGHELEPVARDVYAFDYGVVVTQVGFVEHDSGLLGWSPDGLILDSEGKITKAIEIKCLERKAYLNVAENMEIPTEYYKQIQFAMWASGVQIIDFIVYHPQFEKLIVIPCKPDYQMFEQLNERLKIAEDHVAYWIGIVDSIGNRSPAIEAIQEEQHIDLDIVF